MAPSDLGPSVEMKYCEWGGEPFFRPRCECLRRDICKCQKVCGRCLKKHQEQLLESEAQHAKAMEETQSDERRSGRRIKLVGVQLMLF